MPKATVVNVGVQMFAVFFSLSHKRRVLLPTARGRCCWLTVVGPCIRLAERERERGSDNSVVSGCFSLQLHSHRNGPDRQRGRERKAESDKNGCNSQALAQGMRL